MACGEHTVTMLLESRCRNQLATSSLSRSDKWMWYGVKGTLDIPRRHEKSRVLLCGVFNKVEQTDYGSASPHATPVSMLIRVKKVQSFPGTIGTLDDDRC